MGPKEIKIDHQITYELWLDSLFWETAPSWEEYREEAEVLAIEAFEAKTSLLISGTKLYNKWISKIKEYHETAPDKVQEIVRFIREKRGKPLEVVVMFDGRSKLILSEAGNEKKNKAY